MTTSPATEPTEPAVPDRLRGLVCQASSCGVLLVKRPAHRLTREAASQGTWYDHPPLYDTFSGHGGSMIGHTTAMVVPHPEADQ